MNRILFVLLGIFTMSLFADFYVIPVTKKMKNVVTVAKSGGDFSDIKAALASITDASSANPYVIYVGPGEYTISDTPIQMKNGISIIGSGKKSTILKGAINTSTESTSAIIVGSPASLENLAIINLNESGTSGYSIGVYNTSRTFELKNVSISVRGGIDAYGITFNSSGTGKIEDVDITVSRTGTPGASTCKGVYNQGTAPVMDNMSISVSYCNSNIGVHNYHSSGTQNTTGPVMNNINILVENGAVNKGVYNYISDAKMNNVTVHASGGTGYNYGVYNYSATPLIRHCKLYGETDGIYGGTALMSIIEVGGGNNAKCYHCFKENGTKLQEDCSELLY